MNSRGCCCSCSFSIACLLALLLISSTATGVHSLKSLLSSYIPEQIIGFCATYTEAADNIAITCKPNEVIAIHEAFLTTASGGNQCPFLTSAESRQPNQWNNPYQKACRDDLRMSLNRKCSGFSNCTFSLKQDHLDKCAGIAGFVVVRHACVANLVKYCNWTPVDQFGYIATPGYPEFYPRLENCAWMIEGRLGQRVVIDLLDIQMREPDSVMMPSRWRPKQTFKCVDTLHISDSTNGALNVCGQDLANLLEVRSVDNKITITFNASSFTPARGVLLRYSLQGCPTISAPPKGHLLYRNDTIAQYTCCKDHVFEDTRQLTRILYCVHGLEWNATVSKCIPATTEVIVIDHNGPIDVDKTIYSHPMTQLSTDTRTLVSDFVAPTALLIILIGVNALIVYGLVKARKRARVRRQTESITLSKRATNV